MENQVNLGDQNAQQIEQNPIDQTVLVPEKPKINYWMILTIVFITLFLMAVSVFLLTRMKKEVADIQKIIPQPTTTNQTISNMGVLTYLDLKGDQIVVDLDNDTKQTISTKCKNEGDPRMGIWEAGYHWTSDGENLVISCSSGNWYEYNTLNKDIKTLGIDGNDTTVTSELQLSKDANSVFHTSEQKTWQINLISGKRTELFAEETLRFSPDETKAVIVRVVGKDGLNDVEKFFVLDLLTKKETEIIPPSNSRKNYLFDFNFSSDGNTLAYAYDTNILENDINPGSGTRTVWSIGFCSIC